MEHDNLNGRLSESAEYGQHIRLGCVNHPDLHWSTKNIAPIGCRTIFFNLDWDPTMGPECDCPMSKLYVYPVGE